MDVALMIHDGFTVCVCVCAMRNIQQLDNFLQLINVRYLRYLGSQVYCRRSSSKTKPTLVIDRWHFRIRLSFNLECERKLH